MLGLQCIFLGDTRQLIAMGEEIIDFIVPFGEVFSLLDT